MKLEVPGIEIVAHTASELQPITQGWLWPPYLPLGHLSLLVGEPGVGKSLLSYELAAWTTTGRWPVWPEADAPPPPPPADVLMFCGEDAARTNVRQRLELAGADMDRVRIVQGVRAPGEADTAPFFLDQHGELLDRLIGGGDYRLVVLDTLTSLLSRGEPSSHGGARVLLRPLIEAAHEHGVAMCAVLHLGKQSYNHALHRVAGSGAFTAAARSVLHISDDGVRGGRRVLASRKSNYSGPAPALAFEISAAGIRWEKEPVQPAVVPALGRVKMRSLAETIVWLRKRLTPPGSSGSIASSPTGTEAALPEVPGAPRPQMYIPPGTSDAVRRVLQSLPPPALSMPSATDGVAVTDILEELEAERITERTLRRAKEHLCVKAFRPPGGKGWRWMLP